MSAVAVSGSTVTLTLSRALAAGAVVELDYRPGASPLRDVGGTAAAAEDDVEVVNRTPDPAPGLVSAVGVGAELTLTFDEALDEGSVPSAGDFALRAGGSAVAVATVAVEGSTVVLGLGEALATGSAAQLDYTPGAAPIRDTGGTAAAAFAGEAVAVGVVPVAVSFTNGAPVVTEGTSAGMSVTLDADPARTVVVELTATPGAGTVAGDFSGVPGSLTFTSGHTVRVFTFTAADNALDEADKSVELGFGTLPAWVSAGSQATSVVRLADDEVPVLSVADAGGTEGDVIEFEVTLAPVSRRAVTVTWSTADGTGSAGATAGEDYTAASGMLSFAPGETSATIAVQTLDDTVFDGAETFTVRLDAASGAGAAIDPAARSATGTVADDAAPPAFTVADAVGAEAAGAVDVVVSLAPASAAAATVRYATADGTASAASDYVAAAGTLTFAPGETRKTVRVRLDDDAVWEGDERFEVRLSNGAGGTIAGGTAQVTVTDAGDAATVGFEAASLTVTEGTDTAVEVVVASDRTIRNDVSLVVAPHDGTAAAPGDFAGTAVTLTFSAAAAASTLTTSVAIVDDAAPERDEAFVLILSAAGSDTSGVVIGRDTLTVTIVSDDVAVPGAPADLSARAILSDRVRLSWTEPPWSGAPIDGYRIEVSADAGANWTTLVADTGASATTHEHTGLAGTTTRHYRVSAINSEGTGPASDAAHATTPAAYVPGPVAEHEVPSGWSLVPAGVGFGERFRLLVVTRDTGAATSTGPAGYDAFVQADVAAQGMADISSYASQFRVLGCAGSVGAAANTASRSSDPGASIHWLGGARLADGYADFYDGDWDAGGGYRFADGTRGTSSSFRVFQGCDGDGTPSDRHYLGAAEVKHGIPFGSSLGLPDDDRYTTPAGSMLPFYGLSPVFRVAAAGTDPALSALALAGAQGDPIDLTPAAFDPETLAYTASVANGVTAVTVTAAPADGNAAVAYVPAVDSDLMSEGRQVALSVGANAIEVQVTAEDGNSTRTYTVTVTRAPPELTIADAAALEGAGVEFTVTSSGAASGEVTVQYTTSDGTATAGTDYTAASARTLTIATGMTSATLTVATTGDAADENDETFTVTLASPSTNAALGARKTATGTIVDDDGRSTVSIEDASAEEGEAVAFTVHLSHASSSPVTVQYTTSDGTGDGAAEAGTDYTAASARTLSIGAGETSAAVSIATTEDTKDEEDETFVVTLASPSSNAELGNAKTATGTIVDDDVASADATLSALALADAHGNPIGLTPATFDPATPAYTAYVASGVTAVTVTPEVGNEHATFAYVPPVDSDSGSEGHQVALSVGANPIEVQVTAEDANSTRTYTVTVTRALGQVAGVALTPGSGQLQVDWNAVTGADGYKVQWRSGGETFAGAAAGGREAVIASGTTTTRTITGLANGTAYTVRVLATKAGLAHGPASREATETPALPALTIGDASATEGTGVAFTVTLSRAAADEVTVEYTTGDGTGGGGAEAGTDYTAAAGRTLTLGAGETSATLTIATAADAADENDETFTVTLASPSANAALGAAATATGTIVDDDGTPTVSIEDAAAEEGEGVGFAVNLSHAGAGEITVQYTTSNGTASSSDYTAAAHRTLTFGAGETSATLTIATTEDTAAEDDETFTVTLASPSSNAALGARRTATGTIVDDDLSADATLRALVLTDPHGNPIGLTPAFAADRVMYAVAVASGVTAVTVTPAPGDGNATVAYVPAVDSDLTSEGHQVALAVGVNAIEVPVTAEDGNTTATYTVAVTRALGQVTQVFLTPGAGELTVRWNAVTGADGYRVQWRSGTETFAGAAAGGREAAVDSGTTTTWLLTGLMNGTAYTVRVIATKAGLEDGPASLEATRTPALPELTIVEEASAAEGAGVEFTVSLSRASADEVTVEYTTGDATATSGDYTAAAGRTLTLDAGSTSATLTIATTADTEAEDDETFTVTLSHPSAGATLGAAKTATGTIVDDDVANAAPTFGAATARRSFAETVGDATVQTASNVGDPIAATDADAGDTLEYGLAGTDAAKFTVVPESGQIRTRAGERYDREAKASYAVTVMVTDGNDGSDTIDATLDVDDATEPPPAPLAPSVEATSGSTTSSLDARWSAPAITGRPVIDSYDVQYLEGAGGPWISGAQDVTGTSATIAGLAASTSYQVRVRATNTDGDGPWSLPGTGRTTTPATGSPAISGTAQVGQTLSVVTAGIADADGLTSPTWAYQWVRVATGAAETDISGATGATYTLAAADEGKHVKVRVTFLDDDGNDEALTSAAFPATGATAPASGTRPVLESAYTGLGFGTPRRLILEFDKTLDVGDSALPLVSSFTVVASGDVMELERVIGLSDSTGVALDLKILNTATILFRRGEQITVSYVDPTSGDDGAALQGSDGEDVASFTGISVTNNSVVDPVAPNTPPRNLEATASGKTSITLAWEPPLRNGGSPITGYTVQRRDADGDTLWPTITGDGGTGTADTTFEDVGLSPGTTYDYRVSGINAIGGAATSGVLTNNSVSKIASATTLENVAATGKPSISGTAAIQETLTASTSGIVDANGTTKAQNGDPGYAYTYQWVRVDGDGTSNPEDIVNAVGATHVLSAADVGRKVRVRVSFTDDADTDEAVVSDAFPPSGPVLGADNDVAATGAPAIVGKPYVGRTLTASTSGIADANGTTKADSAIAGYAWTYRWFRVDADGTSNPTDIVNAVGATHVLSAADAGTKVKVAVSFTDDADNAEGPLISGALPSSGLVRTVPSLDIGADSTRSEGDDFNVDVELSSASAATVTVRYRGVAGTADGLDYGFGASSTLTFAPGETTARIMAVVVDDGLAETEEHFHVELHDADEANIGRSRAKVTIPASDGTLAPSAPAGLQASAEGPGAIGLLWLPPATTGGSVITGFRIEWSADGTSAWQVLVEDTESAAIIYSDTGLAPATTRYYRVSAINQTGNVGPPSDPAHATTAPANTAATGAPAISGTAQVGQTLSVVTAGIADADGLTGPTWAYQWVRVATDAAETDISGATGATYTLLAADEGKRVKVRVTFQDDNGNDEALTSAAFPATGTTAAASGTRPVLESAYTGLGFSVYRRVNLVFDKTLDAGASALPPLSSFTVVASGDVMELERAGGLSDSTGVWLDLKFSTSYVFRQGEQVTVSYVDPTSGDDGAALQGSGGEDVASFTGIPVTNDSALAPVVPITPPRNLVATASGKTSITLDWRPPRRSGGSPITGYLVRRRAAEADPWVTVLNDTGTADTTHEDSGLSPGTTYYYQVTARNAVGTAIHAATLSNVASATTLENVAATGKPSISGTARVRETLTASTSGIMDANGTAKAQNGDPGYAYTYQWVRVDGDGTSNPQDIENAVSGTHVLTAADAGRKVKVRVSFTDDADSDETVVSDAWPSTGTVTLRPAVTLVLSDDSISENGGTSTVTATVSPGSVTPFTVTVSARAVAPAAAGDFIVSANGVLSFPAHATESAGTVSVTGVNNDVDAPDATVTVSGAVSGTGVTAPAHVTLTLEDDDTARVRVSRTALTVTEEDAAGGTYTVVLGSRPTADVTVAVAGHAGTGVGVTPSTLTFTASSWRTARTVTVTAAGDADRTDDSVALSHAAASTDSRYGGIGVPGVAVTVTDDDTDSTDATLDALVLADAHGNPIGLTPAFAADTFLYAVSVASGVAAVTVTPEVGDEHATVAYMPSVDSDFTSEDHQVALSVGSNALTVTVTAEDGLTTKAYTVTVTRALGRVAGVALTPGSGQLKVDWNAVTGAHGYRVQWRSGGETFAGAATDGREAVIGSGTTTTRTITGLANGTAYTVRVLATKAGLEDGPASAEMTETPALPELTIGDASATEGAGVAFTVSLSRAAAGEVTVGYTTSDGTGGGGAEAGTDYTAAAAGRTLTIDAGSTSAALTIATTEDATDESDETFTVTLASPSANAALGVRKTATGTIVDDDGDPTVSIEDAEADEGEAVEFTVNLSHASSGAVTVQYTTADGTATAGTDYTAAAARTLTLGTGETSATLTIATTPDTTAEDDETFTVTLASPSSNAALGARRTATGTIVDDDLSADATLSALALTDAHGNPIGLTPAAFDPGRFAYTASVASGVAAVTVTPAPASPHATLAYTPSVDTDFTSDGHQVALTVGVNPIEVRVRAQDGNGTETYTVAVTRALGQVAQMFLTAGSGRITVRWRAVTGAHGYKVQWLSGMETFADAADEGREAVITSGTTTTHTITGLANGTAYTVRVLATKAGLADGPASPETTVTPSLPALTIEDATATEGAGVAFTVRLSRAAAGAVTVGYATSDGTGNGAAEAGTDYTAASGRTLTLGAGTTSATLTIATTEDATDESDETFTVTLSSPSANAKLGSAKTATGTIVDDDGTPTVSIEDAAAEAEEGAGVEFTVTLSHVSAGPVTVQYTTGGGTATAGTDYTAAANRTLTLGAGSTRGTFTIATTGDTTHEDDETFTVTLSNPSSNAALGARRTATGTIVDDDASSDATLGALALTGAQGGSIGLTPAAFDPGRFTYTASVANAVTAVTVAPAPGDGNAAVAYVPSVDSDLTSPGHQVALSVGLNPIEVTVTAEDGNTTRTYTVTVGRSPAQVPWMSLTPGPGRMTVDWRAVSGADGYKVQWRSGTQTFAAAAGDAREAVIGSGATTTHTITGLAGGTAYTVRVLATKAGLADGPASPETTAFTPVLSELTIADASATEGSAVVFTVTLNRAASSSVTVEYSATVEAGDTATLDAAAPGGADFTAASGTLTVMAGSTTGTVSIATAGDTTDEDDETFTVTLSSPSTNAELGAAQTATGTIEDDDSTPALTIADASATEGFAVAFTVELDAPSSSEVTVMYSAAVEAGDTATLDASAPGGADFTAASGTLTVTAGSTTGTVSIATAGDTTHEDDETFTVTLTSPAGATLAGASKAQGTIVDDDSPPAVEVPGDVSVTEGAGVTAQVAVGLSAASGRTVTVDWATADDSAVAGSDYTAASGTLTFDPGVTSMTITVAILDDGVAEPQESLDVILSNAASATLPAHATVAVTIGNDDGTAATGKPAISGTAQARETLTASTGDILDDDGLSGVVYRYQWVRVAGAVETDIPDATGRTYVVLTADVGNRVKVAVSFTDDAGNAEALTSDAWPQIGTIAASVALEVGWEETDYDYAEDEGSPEIAMVLHSGDPVGNASIAADLVLVPITANDDPADGNQDYVWGVESTPLVIPPGGTRAVYAVQLLDDGLVENIERFRVRLTNVRFVPEAGAVLDPGLTVTLSPSEGQVSILDNDITNTWLEHESIDVGEGVGSVEIRQIVGPELVEYDFTVIHLAISGEAVGGTDYAPHNDFVEFAGTGDGQFLLARSCRRRLAGRLRGLERSRLQRRSALGDVAEERIGPGRRQPLEHENPGQHHG